MAFKDYEIKLFADNFLEAALWADSANDSAEEDAIELHGGAITREGLQELKQYCADFLKQHGELVKQAIECGGYDITHAGHDLFMTQAGHGVGYWDRHELGKLSRVLTNAVKQFDTLELEWWNPDWEQEDVHDIPDREYYPREGVQITFRRYESFGKREQRLKQEELKNENKSLCDLGL